MWKTKYNNYYLVKDYHYNKYTFNIVRFIEKEPNNKDKIFTYITNLNINHNNIKKVVELGRRRWKIENQGFNIQKNNIFDIRGLEMLHYHMTSVDPAIIIESATRLLYGISTTE